MAKLSKEQLMMQQWWMKLSLAVIFLVVSYGFISLAIDSGSLWEYAAGIIFLVGAVKHIVQVVASAVRK